MFAAPKKLGPELKCRRSTADSGHRVEPREGWGVAAPPEAECVKVSGASIFYPLPQAQFVPSYTSKELTVKQERTTNINHNIDSIETYTPENLPDPSSNDRNI